MTREERFKASREQIETYYYSQYFEWRLVAVKSIRKILLELDQFYKDDIKEYEKYYKDDVDVLHLQIRNGWFFEAVAQAEQAIEDLFSVLMNLRDISFFVKDELYYSAGKVKEYIRGFDVDSFEEICKQFDYPYFDENSLDENEQLDWRENGYDIYREAVELTQKYVKELKEFHHKYYEDYCQYKHGLSVGLVPMQAILMKSDIKREKEIMSNPSENALYTFHNGTIGDYEKRTGKLPGIVLNVKPQMQKHITELHNEKNLLFSTINVVDINEVVKVTEYASNLLRIVWFNILKRAEDSEDSKVFEVCFPSENKEEMCVIGFPKDET